MTKKFLFRALKYSTDALSNNKQEKFPFLNFLFYQYALFIPRKWWEKNLQASSNVEATESRIKNCDRTII